MADQGKHYEKSWIFHHSRELVDIRRKVTIMEEYIFNEYGVHQIFKTGSTAEGFFMEGSDADVMCIDSTVDVMCPNEDTNPPSDSRDKTIFIMRKADSRPCYVTLELVKKGRSCNYFIEESIVPVHDLHFISSEMYTQCCQDKLSAWLMMKLETHGPAISMKNVHSHAGFDIDNVFSFPCASWPPVANEWLIRSRLHGWPEKALIHDISKSGCHVVPVGDKTSADTCLQWRISFATAERKLIHSLTHDQFLVYGMLKDFLKKISGKLEEIIGDADILSSYIMKTVVLFAVENTLPFLWKEQNTLLCFMHCLTILVAWINAGYCPNYFIIGNNMFHGKLNGAKQQKLVLFLMEFHDMTRMCLSVGTVKHESIRERIESLMNGEWKPILLSPQEIEYDRDIAVFTGGSAYSEQIFRPLNLLSQSKSDIEEFITYRHTVASLCGEGMKCFGEHISARGNKDKYTSLRKCKNFMKPLSSMTTSPGQLTLATFYYHMGNYMNALALCGNMILSFKLYLDHGSATFKQNDMYQHLYCGRGYTLLRKYQEVIVYSMVLPTNVPSFCPSQIHAELTKGQVEINIPPLPYALFLSFLCYHELGDTRRRFTTSLKFLAVKYDEEQGCAKHWIVHNLIGICYEIQGYYRKAIREYKDSLSGEQFLPQFNPARERIARLKHTMQSINTSPV